MSRTKKSHHVAPASMYEDDAPRETHDHDYSELLELVQKSFSENTQGKTHLFQVESGDLFDAYLRGLPAERQLHNCHACRRFIQRYGGLVTIDSYTGRLTPVMWTRLEVPEFYRFAFASLTAKVAERPVLGEFKTREPVWGEPVTGNWRHMAVRPPKTFIHTSRGEEPHQYSAEIAHRVETVERALVEFEPRLLKTALKVLESDTLSRAEKYVAPVQWLLDLHDRPKRSPRLAKNVLWARVAAAPEGFAHPRSSVVGSLLEDIEKGKSYDAVKKSWEAKVHPAVFSRPQAPPKAGNVAASEALVARLGIEPSLHRRHATFAEVPKLWMPTPDAGKRTAPTGGVFAGVASRGRARKTEPTQSGIQSVVTWYRFSDKILPKAARMQILLPREEGLIALTAAQDELAPPILKWDRPEQRNHFSWYTYVNKRPVEEWSLRPGWTDVDGVTTMPNTWGDRPIPEISEGAIFLIEGARDRQAHTAGLALFPELLRSELHEARSTIEAYSKSRQLASTSAPLAQGVDFRKVPSSQTRKVDVRVLVEGTWDMYQIDRWN